MGVALMASTSTLARSFLSRSLCPTPNRCSSSMTTSPRSLNRTRAPSSWWVPMTISTLPSATSWTMALASAGLHEPVEHLDPQGEAPEAFLEGAEVLEAEDGGRAQHRHLVAVQGHLGGGPHGHLGLAEAHVPAQQAVHGPVALQVGLDGLGGLDLVRRGLEREGGLELRHLRAVLGVGVALLQLALGVELEQLLGHVPDGLPGPALDLGPGRSAQLVQGRRHAPVRRHVALDQVGPLQADVEPAAVGVAQLDHLLLLAAHGQGAEALRTRRCRGPGAPPGPRA